MGHAADLGHAEFKTGLVATKIITYQLALPALQEVASVLSGTAGAEVVTSIPDFEEASRFRTVLKEFLPAVAAHSRFAPETARRLGSVEFTKALKIDLKNIDEFVAKQERWLVETMQGMDDESQAALALLYMKHGAIESPVSLSSGEMQTIERLGSSQAGCIRALESLRGSFLQMAHTADGRFWRYKHPTIGGAFCVDTRPES